MTLLYSDHIQGQPGTHVLAIGVGSYPHLLGGTAKLTNKPLGLKQLASPPASLSALLDWFFAPLHAAGEVGFVNAHAPLATVEALASSAPSLTITTPTGAINPEAATRQNIQQAFEDWLARLKSHPDNVGVFYFCGHGVMVSDHYLLAEDFGHSDAQPWNHAFDISNTIRAIEREVAGAVYYFIDSCREIATDIAMSLGATPTALLSVDLAKKVIRQSVTIIYATGEGELAFAPLGGQPSRFTSALLSAMSGYCGTKTPGSATWAVDGESIATAVRGILEYEALTALGTPQVSEQSIQGRSAPLLRLPKAPKVKVRLDLRPAQRRASYELYLESNRTGRITQPQPGQVFQIEVTRGFYDVGALDPSGQFPAIFHEGEELIPPTWSYVLESQP